VRARLKQLSLTLMALLVIAAPLASGVAQALPPASYQDFPLQTGWAEPNYLVEGMDGGIWFTESTSNYIGHISTSNVLTEYPIPTSNARPIGITAGSDGNIWFTEINANQIGRITPAGEITEFAIPTAESQPYGITTGADGNMWFTEIHAGRIARITPAGEITEFATDGIKNWITAGPDGGLWVTTGAQNSILRYDTDGNMTGNYPVRRYADPTRITTGPDGALWFAQAWASTDPSAGNKIGRITTTGEYTEYPVPVANGYPVAITSGPNGLLWFNWHGDGITEQDRVFSLSPSGEFTDYAGTREFRNLGGITADSEGNLWYSDRGLNSVVKMNLTNAPEPEPEVATNLSLTPTSGVGNVDSTANFTATASGTTGNPIPGALVRFGVSGSSNLSGQCVTDSAGACTFNYSGPSLPGADSINAYVDTNLDGLKSGIEPAAAATQAWLIPSATPGQTAGGGHIDTTNGSDIAFGFTAKNNPSGLNGSCEVIDQSSNIDIHCQSVSSVIVGGTTGHATIFGTAIVNQGEITNYRIDVQDSATPGRGVDSFAITTASGLAYSGTLTAGNNIVNP